MKRTFKPPLAQFGACLGLAVSVHASAQDTNRPPALRLLECPRPLIIAHRGYCQIAPENTLPAFQFALEAGADIVELDYHESSDGRMLVIHDADLDRTTDAEKRFGKKKTPVKSTLAAEIQSLDAGTWFDAKFAGTKVPSLEEALDFIQGRGGVTLIERKAGSAEKCAELLVRKKLVNQAVVQSFDWQFIRQFRELQPQQVLGVIGPPKLLCDGSKPGEHEKMLDTFWLDLLKPARANFVVWNHLVTADAVKQVHALGMRIYVYTINDPAKANELLDMGVDGLITNNTSLMWRTLALRQWK